jgi:Putative amidoligase enzyme
MNIIDLYPLKAVAGDFGIEIEVEGKNLPREVNQYWRCEADNSLRGESMEYIFSKPQPLNKVKTILNTLVKKFKDTGSVLDFSFRTSVHVHMNVQNITPERVLSTIYTYLLLEDPLMNLCGDNRKGNRFCLRLQDAEGLVERLSLAFGNIKDGFAYIPKDTIRYSALNVEAIVKYGSIEFRAMQGNCDVDRITNWCTLLNCLKVFTEKYDTPMDVYEFYNKVGPEDFAKEVFREWYHLVDYKGLQKDIAKGYSLSIDLPFAFKRLAKVKKNTFDEIIRAVPLIRPAPRKPVIARIDEGLRAFAGGDDPFFQPPPRDIVEQIEE